MPDDTKPPAAEQPEAPKTPEEAAAKHAARWHEILTLPCPAGRKPLPLDLETVEKLAALQVTDEELASFFRVSVRTIERRKKSPAFAAAIARGKARGKTSLRRLQWLTANSYAPGHVTMQIWLGKQMLGQKDRVATEHTGLDGGPIELIDARSRLADLLAKRAASGGASSGSGKPE